MALPNATLAPRCRFVPMILSCVPPAVEPRVTGSASTDGPGAVGNTTGEGPAGAAPRPHATAPNAPETPIDTINFISLSIEISSSSASDELDVEPRVAVDR